MSGEHKPWAHVAHKDGIWFGVIAANLDHCKHIPAKEHKRWAREVSKFCGDFIADGYTITTVYSRGEYDSFNATLSVPATGKEKKKARDLFGDEA